MLKKNIFNIRNLRENFSKEPQENVGRIFLHVGPHKTGTTYLQSMLLRYRNSLHERGVIYPDYLMEAYAHHNIPRFYSSFASALNVKNQENNPIQPIDPSFDTIYSSENFTLLDRESCARLRDDLINKDVKIVYFIRDLRKLWYSHWQEEIKHGSVVTYLEYIGNSLGYLSSVDTRRADPVLNLRKFSDVFGRENLIIGDYDRLAEVGGNLFDFLCERVLGVDSPRGAETEERVNPSLNHYVIEIMRNLNQKYISEKSKLPGISVREQLMRCCDEFQETDIYREFIKMIDAFSEDITFRRDDIYFKEKENRILGEFSDRIVNYDGNGRVFSSKEDDVIHKHLSVRALSNPYWRDLVSNAYDFTKMNDLP